MVTHPFHPLYGRQLRVLGGRWFAGRLTFFCEADGHRIGLRQEWTDRGPEPDERRIAVEGLVAMRVLLDDLMRSCRLRGQR